MLGFALKQKLVAVRAQHPRSSTVPLTSKTGRLPPDPSVGAAPVCARALPHAKDSSECIALCIALPGKQLPVLLCLRLCAQPQCHPPALKDAGSAVCFPGALGGSF